MGIDFGSLIIDLEVLASSSKEDFSNEFWSEYEIYLKKYNLILKDLQTLGFFKGLNFIQSVPLSDQSFGSGFSDQEKAKLREIANNSDVLYQKVRLLLSPPALNNKMNDKVRSNKIFLVHGSDNEMKSDVSKVLETLDLDPIILHEHLDMSKNFIEKINDYSHISFAVVLLSSDDLAYSKEKTPDGAKYRASQNVIFELGYFLGRLGNQNVSVIYRKKKDSEIPNDYTGVRWIEYKMGWYYDLIKDLKACNFEVDVNKLSWL
jgi:predicted nucleotide-binding protein